MITPIKTPRKGYPFGPVGGHPLDNRLYFFGSFCEIFFLLFGLRLIDENPIRLRIQYFHSSVFIIQLVQISASC